MEATPGAQAQLNEHGRRIEQLETTRGAQWERINNHDQRLERADTRLDGIAGEDGHGGQLAEIKDDVKSVKRAMWSGAVALGVGSLGIIGVLLSIAVGGP